LGAEYLKRDETKRISAGSKVPQMHVREVYSPFAVEALWASM